MSPRILAVLAFLLLLVSGGFHPALAQENGLFTVSGVHVDASGASSTEALNAAIAQGRAKAFQIIYRRLTRQADWPRQPTLDAAGLLRLGRGFSIANERRSTTRYVASMTYVFNAELVRRLLRSQNIAFVDTTAKPVLVVAMAPGYEPHSAWAMALANPKYQSGEVPILPPDANDNLLGGLDFDTAQWPSVQPAAAHIHASDAFLARLTPGKGSLTVSLRRLAMGAPAPIPDVVVGVKPGEPQAAALAAAADATAAAIVEAWKSRSAVDFSKRLRLTADVRLDSVADWGAILQRLGQIPTISDVNVVAMDTGEARIAITYVGTPDQLQAYAGQNDLGLTNADGTWQLALRASP